MDDIENALRRYCEGALGTAACLRDPVQANKSVDELHRHYLVLRRTQAGKNGIISLMSNEDQNVRLWAARHCLEWAPDAASAVLNDICNTGGLLGFEAEMTLKEYKKGRLKFGPAAGGKTDTDEKEISK
jgi:hypothetical protein